ncbi:MAG TPA: hypothetical protein VKC90_15110 [Chitinophagaceae bacterium]|nr:hypothetical protein [Chitinophagaceae bacterium]
MEKDKPNESQQQKIQIAIGEKIAYVEIISLINYICSVEILGQDPIFITRIKDKNNKPCWISIPQGNDELAATIGKYIEEYILSGE